MCKNYVGRCACSCGCNVELERYTVCNANAGDKDQGCEASIPIYYDIFDYRCRKCWPWSPTSVSSWSRRRRGEHWWYVPFWKRRSIGRLSVGCARTLNDVDGDRTGHSLPSAGDSTSMELLGVREGETEVEDIVTQIYRHLESLYGDALGLGLGTIAELENITGKKMGPVTIHLPPALRGIPLKNLSWC